MMIPLRAPPMLRLPFGQKIRHLLADQLLHSLSARLVDRNLVCLGSRLFVCLLWTLEDVLLPPALFCPEPNRMVFTDVVIDELLHLVQNDLLLHRLL